MAKAKRIELRWNGYAWHDPDNGNPECIPFVVLLRQKPQLATMFKRLFASGCARRMNWKRPRPRTDKHEQAMG